VGVFVQVHILSVIDRLVAVACYASSNQIEKQRLVLNGYFKLQLTPELSKYVFVQKQYSLFFRPKDESEQEAFLPLPLESIDLGVFLRTSHAQSYLRMYQEQDFEEFRKAIRQQVPLLGCVTLQFLVLI